MTLGHRLNPTLNGGEHQIAQVAALNVLMVIGPLAIQELLLTDSMLIQVKLERVTDLPYALLLQERCI